MPKRRSAPVDVQRLGAAVSRPGIDPRTWVTMGRVDDDPDAAHWDATAGWVVDVTFYGSDLEGGDGLPCRVASQGAGDGYGEFIPPSQDAEVVVVLPGGDPEQLPVIVGYASNEGGGGAAPTSVTGLPIDGEAPATTAAVVSPKDAEIKVSPHGRREQYARGYVHQALRHTLISNNIRLGAEAVTEPALLGNITVTNTQELITALQALATSLAAFTTGPLAPLGAIGVTLGNALTTLAPKIPGQRSLVVRLK